MIELNKDEKQKVWRTNYNFAWACVIPGCMLVWEGYGFWSFWFGYILIFGGFIGGFILGERKRRQLEQEKLGQISRSYGG